MLIIAASGRLVNPAPNRPRFGALFCAPAERRGASPPEASESVSRHGLQARRKRPRSPTPQTVFQRKKAGRVPAAFAAGTLFLNRAVLWQSRFPPRAFPRLISAAPLRLRPSQPRLAHALTYSRYRNVTIWARVQAPFGPNRPLLCPLVMPFSSAHCTAAA